MNEFETLTSQVDTTKLTDLEKSTYRKLLYQFICNEVSEQTVIAKLKIFVELSKIK